VFDRKQYQFKIKTQEAKKVDPRLTGEHPVIAPTPVEQYRKAMKVKEWEIARIIQDLRGHDVRPSSLIHLVMDVFPHFKEAANLSDADRQKEAERRKEVQLRAAETRQAYLFLDYLQTIMTKRIQIIPFGVITANLLRFIGFFADKTSKPENYDREKELFWGKTVNRPDRNERQVIKDKVLNSSHASYVERYTLTESAQRQLKTDDAQTMFMTGMMYEQLRALTVHRRKVIEKSAPGKEQNLPFAALNPKESYTIVIHKGKRARKVRIPAELLQDENHRAFHQVVVDALLSSNEKDWTDLTTKHAQTAVKLRSRQGYTGSENISEAKKRIASGDLTAGDLSVVISTTEEMQLDTLQFDYRNSTYGVGFPVSLTFGMNAEHNITDYATKYAHPYTDGAYALEETKRISETVFQQHVRRPLVQEQKLTQPERIHRVSSGKVHEKVIPRERFVERIERLRSFFSDTEKAKLMFQVDAELAKIFKKGTETQPSSVQKPDTEIRGMNLDINFQNLLTIAIMIAHGHDHAHFLEGIRDPMDRKKIIGLAPAVCVVSESITQEVRHGAILKKKDQKKYRSHIYELLTCLSTLDTSRDLTKNGRGPAHILGALLSQDWLRRSMQGAGYVFDNIKTAMLIETTMFSMLVRGNKPWNSSNEYIALQGFTTAFAETYPNEVYGACDRVNAETGKQEVLVTYKTKKGDKVKNVRFNRVEAYLDRIIRDLEAYVDTIESAAEKAKKKKAVHALQKASAR
jgi:hypothetical protein